MLPDSIRGISQCPRLPLWIFFVFFLEVSNIFPIFAPKVGRIHLAEVALCSKLAR